MGSRYPTNGQYQAATKHIFSLKSEGMHQQNDGKLIAYCFWTCTQKLCKKLEGVPIKELSKETGPLFRHLKTCNEDLCHNPRLASKHSKAQLDEDGNEIEVSLEPSTVDLRSNLCSDFRVSSALAPLIVQGMFIVACTVC